MSISIRIRKYCEGKNIRQSELIKKKIAAKGTIDKVWHDKQEPSAAFLINFLNEYKEVNARWLLTGVNNITIEEPRAQYGFCKECLKKEGEIARLEKECARKDKRIEEFLIQRSSSTGNCTGGKKAS